MNFDDLTTIDDDTLIITINNLGHKMTLDPSLSFDDDYNAVLQYLAREIEHRGLEPYIDSREGFNQ